MKKILLFLFCLIGVFTFSQSNKTVLPDLTDAMIQNAKILSDLVVLPKGCFTSVFELAVVVNGKPTIESAKGDELNVKVKELLMNANINSKVHFDVLLGCGPKTGKRAGYYSFKRIK